MSYTENDIEYMNRAIRAAVLSEDESVQNGAAILNSAGDFVTACNEFPRNVESLPERWVRPEKYMWVEHAERNAIYKCSAAGIDTTMASMYCPWAACADCARAIVQSGIGWVYRLPMTEADGWTKSIRIGDIIMQEGGVEVITIPIEEVKIPKGLRLGQFREN